MYVLDLIKRLVHKTNIPTLIYLVINVFVITGIIALLLIGFTGITFWQEFVLALILYMISLFIAMSPFGEWILRLQTGCKKIKRTEQKEFIEPIFQEVYEDAKKLDPHIPNKVKLYINGDSEPNAFATGRKTICITEGLLYMPQDQIKATLGHEFGHLAHKDTDLILLVSVGNLIVSAFVLGFKLVIDIGHITTSIFAAILGGTEGVIMAICNAIYHFFITLFVTGIMWLWTKIGIWLVMKSSRSNEYEADEFSYRLGYGNALCAMLDSLGGLTSKGLFASLESSHPDKDARIMHLQKLGATYRVVYGAE